MCDETITPDEDDGFIDDGRGDRYDVSFAGKHIGTRGNMDAAVGLIVNEMKASQYWPNVWYVNERGNTTLLLITIDEHPSMQDFTWDFSDVAYV